MQAQTTQLIAVAGVLAAFALAELVQGRFFAREATRQDNRLDVAVTLLFPLIGGAVLAAAGALCALLMPSQRDALAHGPVWGMLALLLLADGVGHYSGNYSGNYGNLLFIWDVLLGTALITQRYPPAYGLSDDRAHGPESWLVQFIYPLLRSRRPGTVLGRGDHRPPLP